MRTRDLPLFVVRLALASLGYAALAVAVLLGIFLDLARLLGAVQALLVLRLSVELLALTGSGLLLAWTVAFRRRW